MSKQLVLNNPFLKGAIFPFNSFAYKLKTLNNYYAYNSYYFSR